jgi:predicted Zn-dependent protease
MQRDIPLALSDIINHENSKTDTLSVLKHYQDLAHWQLYNTDLLRKGVNYAINNRKYDTYSVSILHTILSIEREDPFFANTLAALYLLHEDLERSEYWLEKVKDLDKDSILLWYSYARLYALKGDTTKAKNAFEKYIRLRNEQ